MILHLENTLYYMMTDRYPLDLYLNKYYHIKGGNLVANNDIYKTPIKLSKIRDLVIDLVLIFGYEWDEMMSGLKLWAKINGCLMTNWPTNITWFLDGDGDSLSDVIAPFCDELTPKEYDDIRKEFKANEAKLNDLRSIRAHYLIGMNRRYDIINYDENGNLREDII